MIHQKDDLTKWDYHKSLLSYKDDVECHDMYGRVYNFNFVPTLLVNAKLIANQIIKDMTESN